jgi:hypothetical protein
MLTFSFFSGWTPYTGTYTQYTYQATIECRVAEPEPKKFFGFSSERVNLKKNVIDTIQKTYQQSFCYLSLNSQDSKIIPVFL